MERSPMETALSTDVVMNIVLSHLKVRDLLACRKVFKFWNKAASAVLRKRSTMIRKISKERTLKELEECLKQSSDFPFAGLKLDEPWTLCSAEAMTFFETYGARFTHLILDTCWTIKLQDLAPFIHHLPRLSILEVGSAITRPPVPKNSGRKTLELSSVRTFRLCPAFPQVDGDVLREVFAKAPSLERIECLCATYGILRALKDAGKLQAVSVMNVNAAEDQKHNTLRVDELLSTESPALTKLNFNAGRCISREGLMKLLISSQHTLKELLLVGICPAELSSECPVLTKLTTLCLRIFDKSYEYVFQGRQGHKFPALKELKLDIMCFKMVPSIASLSDDLFTVPSLKSIELQGDVVKAVIEDLARSFPNVIQIRLGYFQWSPHSDSPLIDAWSVEAFNFLEKLEIWRYPVQRPCKKYLNMDSFLTGIPTEICEDMSKHTQLDLLDSPLRTNPSILQLKNLKKLVVCVTLQEGFRNSPKGPPFISMVSLRYALRMMPNLEVKFVYDHDFPSDDYDELPHKAVKKLKAAFKHVRPHVELKPFFY